MRKLLFVLVIVIFGLFAGCTTSTHNYEVTDKIEPDILVLGDFKTIHTENITFNKIDIGDHVWVDENNHITSIETKKEYDIRMYTPIAALIFILAIMIGTLIFIWRMGK